MTMKSYNIIFSILFTLSICTNIANGAELTSAPSKTDETIEEFNETRFLSLEKIYTPKELNVITDELNQNAIDVIILSGTHSLVYNTQMNDAGQTKQYKNFYGLKVEILPLPSKDSKYSLRLFYYNWLSKKYDKKLYKEISKYNVLNELRFALYKLFKGSKFIEENQEMIEKSNYDRIQAVAKTIEERKAKKKIDEKKKQLEVIETEKEIFKKKEKTELLKREEDKKKLPKSPPTLSPLPLPPPSISPDTSSAESLDNKAEKKTENNSENKKKSKTLNKKSVEKNNEIPPHEGNVEGDIDKANDSLDSNSSNSVKFISKIAFLAGFSGEFLETSEILKTKTNLRYLNLGASYNSFQELEKPIGYNIEFLSGIPIRKDRYQLPVYRLIKANIIKKNMIPYSYLSFGFEYSPLHFVNLPDLGKSLQVYENDLLWVNISISGFLYLYDKLIEVSLIYGSNILTKSNYNKTINVQRIISSAYLQITSKHGIKIEINKTSINGQVQGSGNGLSLVYSYSFGG